MSSSDQSLRARLNYQPQELRFGTSGRRGLVVHLTQLEIYINALAELDYLLSLSPGQGGIRRSDPFFYASDLRPSSTRFVPEQGGAGEIAQAIEQAIRDAGLQPVNLGQIPTPALSYYALSQGKGSIMVTGSHIPFDRNGYKTNTAIGELLKRDEAPIQTHVDQVRARVYAQPFEQSLFAANGSFKSGHRELSPIDAAGRSAYARRYLDFFSPLRGMRLLVYQHSAVGRDLLVEILQQLGAEVIPTGRSETFVPIDTENIGADLLEAIQKMADQAQRDAGPIDAVVSTDGDSDRPLLLGLENGQVRFFGGDLVGMVVAEYLGADAIVVPISCNDAVDRGALKEKLEPKTKIGSPYVIEGMQRAKENGKKRVCGWEANGGFLVGSDWELGGKHLKALPTRDAVLPILATLVASRQAQVPVVELFRRLPPRFSKAALLKEVPREASLKMIGRLSLQTPAVGEVLFAGPEVTLFHANGRPLAPLESALAEARQIRDRLAAVFSAATGFGPIERINYTDGVRVYFCGGDVAHLRPSGNADELRIYAVADQPARAEEIVRLGVAEPDGILRRLL